MRRGWWQRSWKPQVRTLWQSFTTRLIIVAIVFVITPALVYDLLRKADAEKNSLVLRAVQEEGRLITEALFPHLKGFSADDAENLSELLPRLAAGEGTIKILFRPEDADSSNSFFFVSSYPKASRDALEGEQRRLVETGVLSRVSDSCDYLESLAFDFTNAAGAPEFLTYLAARTAPNGCWVVITSLIGSDLLSSALARPYWRTPELQVAAVVYAFMALFILLLFVDAWQNLRRFSDVARAIRRRLQHGVSFRERNRIPELAGVAADFDNLVLSLRRSEEMIRQAAEENAHALKGPLAVISQSIEPLRNSLPLDDERAKRGICLIEQSIMRLDGLISAARRIEEATAEMLDKPLVTLQLSKILPHLVDDFRPSAESQEIALHVDIAPRLQVLGNEDLFESSIENALENAIDFSPARSTVLVSAVREDETIRIRIEDEGPGVPEKHLDRIFDRSFSTRGSNDGFNGNYGIGLWIVRRNVDLMGGSVRAANRSDKGLRLEIRLPPSP
jgi:two-component system sensor histidine kinase ChvG